ncbi:MAG: PAS domain S-box protein [Rhodospirillales bacterium]|nr:PAS domain S-box protein [Rhodospirillales bacterium]
MFDHIPPVIQSLGLVAGFVLVLVLSVLVFMQKRELAKRADAERRNVPQLRQIIDLVPHMIFARDAEGKFLMANQATADLYGAPVSDLVGAPIENFHSNSEELNRFLMGDRALIERGERVFIPEQTIHTVAGKTRILQTTKIPFEAPGTGEPAILGISVDITEQKRAEEVFGEIVELAPEAIISIDAEHRVILFNRGAETIFGFGAAEVIGQLIHMLLPEQFRAGHGALIDGFSRAPDNSRRMNARGKLAGRRKDGTDFAAEASIGKLQRGGDAAFIVLLRDVSERQLWEDQLRHTQKMEAVGQLTGGVAHDFNNLLTIVLGNLQLLQRRTDGDPKTDRLIERAIAAAQRGGDLTHRLLAFSRRSSLEPKPTDLAQQIDDIVKLTGRTVGENISISVSSGDDLWPVHIDQAQLQGALMNLAINAAQAMPAGGELKFETSNISIDSSMAHSIGEIDPGDYVQVSVIDSGAGMSSKVIERAFDPFFTTRETGEGSGLGLSMVYGFVKQSGGHAGIFSKIGVGTNVTLYFPRAAAEELVEGRVASGSPAGDDGSETVLVVEDNPDVLLIAVSHLVGRGYNVIESANGSDALQKLQDHCEIDVLFTDVMLPNGLSGTELASAALRLRPELKLLFSSGNAKIDVERDFGAESNYIFLPKPYLGDELAVALRNLIDD